MKSHKVLVPKTSLLVVIVLLVTLAASQLITSGGGSRSPVGKGGAETLSNNNGVGHMSMDVSPNCMYDSTDFKIMGDSVERALNFFENNIDKLVLDAAVGTRSLQGFYR